MYKNKITAENTPDSHKEVIKGQINGLSKKFYH